MNKLRIKWVKIDALEANSWNPNKQSDFMLDKTIVSMATFGVIDPLTVRMVDSKYEIVDGEHRWIGIKRLRDFSELVPEAVMEAAKNNVAIQEVLERGELPVINLGEVDDTTAKELTLVLNGIKGEDDTVKLAELITDLQKTVDMVDMEQLLPYTAEELAALSELLDFDWDQYKEAEEEPQPESNWVEFHATIPKNAWPIIESEFDRIGGVIEVDQSKKATVRNGLILEYICVNSAQTPTESLE